MTIEALHQMFIEEQKRTALLEQQLQKLERRCEHLHVIIHARTSLPARPPKIGDQPEPTFGPGPDER